MTDQSYKYKLYECEVALEKEHHDHEVTKGYLQHSRELLDEEARLREKLTGILTRTANALKGPPDELTMWSWHDLPEIAERLVANQSAPGSPEAMKPWWDLVKIIEEECGNTEGRIHSSIHQIVRATIRAALEKKPNWYIGETWNQDYNKIDYYLISALTVTDAEKQLTIETNEKIRKIRPAIESDWKDINPTTPKKPDRSIGIVRYK